MNRGVSVLRNRRGMSPLIATILLMAFAVALGGMIMNWSIDISVNGECDKVDVDVTQFCYEEGSVFLRGQNMVDSIDLVGVKLMVVTDTGEISVDVKNSAVDAGSPLALKIPYGFGAAKVDLIGKVGSAANPYACIETPIERVDPIQPC